MYYNFLFHKNKNILLLPIMPSFLNKIVKPAWGPKSAFSMHSNKSLGWWPKILSEGIIIFCLHTNTHHNPNLYNNHRKQRAFGDSNMLIYLIHRDIGKCTWKRVS